MTSTKQTQKLRNLAESLNEKIQHLRSPDRMTNTHRRLTIAAGMLVEADRFERLKKVTLSIAESIEDGTAIYLKKIKNRTQVETLIREGNRIKRLMDQKKSSYYYSEQHNSYRDTEERELMMEEIMTYTKMPSFECCSYILRDFLGDLDKVLGSNNSREDYDKVMSYYVGLSNQDYIDLLPVRSQMARLLSLGKKHRESKYVSERIHGFLMERKRLESLGIQTDEDYRNVLIEFMAHVNGTQKSVEQRRIDQIKMKEKEVAQTKIPSYFPTPKTIVNQMIEEADIEPSMRVLEPSAGSGHIADDLLETGAEIDVIEINYRLRDLLEQKGHRLVGQDFLQFQEKNIYDRIIMNPPFESGLDVQHIRHAYKLLKQGGKIVALSSEGPFFRQDNISREFREFLEQNEGYSVPLPPNTFRASDRPTGVNSRLLVIEKPQSEIDCEYMSNYSKDYSKGA
ncbi:phospholipid N-methyltransferase/cell division protein ZapA (FtsZ GTPase activity inhibitor) [Croceifilum oryzae]|uniref:Phospholipid N-methyltransferase/cell division protein ZapA (FtsZ GTPase activity inhibitor) n=1 Tax=Croceifilum oryzae TaxID=1553429 RepID=A0AAJ1THT5_9BACL|nr:rRNA adenine N-6-methyltransferase family protein [Croceifilum oryzae]MDQ0418739.1 phospholipid N-methyltransferase/cell division protein ZapA (FtsZ GTPase activity inhibitor) [Croceifilum oryzae]